MNQVFKLKGSLVEMELEPYTDKKDVSFRMSYGGINQEKTLITTVFSIEELKTIIGVMQSVVKHCDVPEINAPTPIYRKDLSDRL